MSRTLPVTIPAISNEYIQVELTKRAGSTYLDLTTTTVEFAFTATDVAPVENDWNNGEWESRSGTKGDYARVLVGDQGVSLGAGSYDVHVRVTNLPDVNEAPILEVGQLTIT